MLGARGVLLDSNLLLLLAIGTMDRGTIRHFKRTQQFTANDLDALIDIIAHAGRVLTTPHILTEVSNLANSLREDQRRDFADTFRGIIQSLDERWTPAREYAKHPLFLFGIADVAALTESRDAWLLTEDGRFASQVNGAGGYAVSLEVALKLREQES